MKDKKILGIIIGVVVVLALIGAVFAFRGGNQEEASEEDELDSESFSPA